MPDLERRRAEATRELQAALVRRPPAAEHWAQTPHEVRTAWVQWVARPWRARVRRRRAAELAAWVEPRPVVRAPSRGPLLGAIVKSAIVGTDPAAPSNLP